MKNIIFAIDPGNELSGYVIVQHDGSRITKIIDGGKIDNISLLDVMSKYYYNTSENPDLVIEKIESFGMPVGRSVFDTCIWIGQFIQHAAEESNAGVYFYYITRREEKLTICGSPKAKDANIRQALIDKYARFDLKNGKGTKREPDFFFGFKADMWSAFAVADTHLELNVKNATK